jgi:hypothetical protein
MFLETKFNTSLHHLSFSCMFFFLYFCLKKKQTNKQKCSSTNNTILNNLYQVHSKLKNWKSKLFWKSTGASEPKDLNRDNQNRLMTDKNPVLYDNCIGVFLIIIGEGFNLCTN